MALVMPGQKREARLRARCPGLPRLASLAARKTWMAGTSPAMTEQSYSGRLLTFFTQMRTSASTSGSTALTSPTVMPKIRKWVSHARVKKVVERPLLGRYLFVEVDYPRQSFDDVAGAQGVESIISLMGVPCVMPRADVEDLLSRYLAGEFDQVANEAIPIGARVCIVEGKFDNWLATVTGRGKGGRFTVKLLGENVHLNKVSPYSVRPALGSDLSRRVSHFEA
jgi:transcription antitermination factor NusG